MTRVKSILFGSVSAVALSGFAGAAYAADMAVKAPESLFSGVTFYGQLDVGGGCQNHGAPPSSSGLPAYMLVGNTNANESLCMVASNIITQSLVGVKIEKPIGYGFTAIADISTGFLPGSGEASSAIGSIGRNNTAFFAGNNSAFGDGGRDGQLFNGPVFAGLSSATFGTLTVGRISTLQRDNVLNYDPQGGAYAFSLIGFYGAFSGTGDTENAFWDGAIKYVWDGGPLHFGAAASSGSPDYSQQGAYSVDVGLHSPSFLPGFSIDAMYAHVKDGVSTFAPFNPGTTQLLPTVGAENQFQTRVSDNTSYSVQGKYVINLPGWGGGCAPCYTKAAPTPATFTLYGGWQHYERADPSNPIVNGTSMIGNGIMGIVNNFEYVTPTLVDVYWVGGKYAVNAWTFTGAWYHQTQNSWLASAPTAVNSGIGAIQAVGAPTACNGLNNSNTKAGSGSTAGLTVFAASSNCAGTFDVVSGVIDYAFNKYVDLYTGVNWNHTEGGFSSGNQFATQISGWSGLRLKF
jgi:predicted porin